MLKAIQYTETLANELEADSTISYLSLQDGFLGGRVLAPSPEKPGWRIQIFFRDETGKELLHCLLPDGCKAVLIPPFLASVFGITLPD